MGWMHRTTQGGNFRRHAKGAVAAWRRIIGGETCERGVRSESYCRKVFTSKQVKERGGHEVGNATVNQNAISVNHITGACTVSQITRTHTLSHTTASHLSRSSISLSVQGVP